MAEITSELVKGKISRLRNIITYQTDTGVECTVCLDTTANIIFIPCNHQVVCILCFLDLVESFMDGNSNVNCTICRKHIDNVILKKSTIIRVFPEDLPD
jgi:hypothetical protein